MVALISYLQRLGRDVGVKATVTGPAVSEMAVPRTGSSNRTTAVGGN
jgi:hypothetical protein